MRPKTSLLGLNGGVNDEEGAGQVIRGGWPKGRCRGRRGGEGGGQRGMVSVTRPVILQQEGQRFPAVPVASCSSGVHSTRGRTDRFGVSKY